ncbi:MAG: MBL fold metallo-hydrolase [Candidatus Pacearchaeota archaeon]|jgi:metallo-beta-lactamase family protein
MELKFFGAAGEVTGSCYSLTTSNEQILIDCGMFQGGKDMERLNYENFDFDPKKYSTLILTHAHLDHCGRLPKLIKYGFKGKIFATEATRDLALIILMDAAKIAKEDTEHENKRRREQGLPPRSPIYNDIDVKNTMKLFVTAEYDKEIKVSKDVTAVFYDAGHILGSASVQLKVIENDKTKLIVFSGDLGQSNAILVEKTEPINKGDYVLVESTYGDRLHPPVEERQKEFIRIINESYKKGGKLLIPSFAIERAQEIIYYLGEFMQAGLIPKMDVYLDSPMAVKATAVFSKYSKYYNSDVQNSIKKKKDPFNFPGLISTPSVEESKQINFVNKPCIIIAGNGMCTGGRIKHHIRNNIEDPKNTLLFVGYQVTGTLGYWLKKGEKKVRLLGVQVRVNAKVEAMDGFSAHADYNDLINWLDNFSPKPKKVFVVHGDKEQSVAFLKRIEAKGFVCCVPSILDTFTL